MFLGPYRLPIFPFLVIISLLLLFSYLGSYPIYILDEARNAEAAREMLLNRDYVLPTFNGNLRTDKPPLHYFFMILSFNIFGINAFSARFFSSFFGMLTFTFTYWFARRNFDQLTAIIALGIMLSSMLFLQEFRLAVPDSFLIFFLSVSFFSFYEALKLNSKFFYFVFYVSMGLAILAKGPIAIILPALSIFIFLLWSNKLKLVLKNWVIYLFGILLVGAIAFPWYILAHLASNGAWTEGFLFNHNLNRFSEEMEGHGGSVLRMLFYILIGMFPASLFIPTALRFAFINRKANQGLLYCFSIAITVIVFFTFSGTQLPHYPMPAYPFLAIVIGAFLSRSISLEKAGRLSWYFITYFVLALFFPLAVYLVFKRTEMFYQYRHLSLDFLIIPITALLALFFYKKRKIKQAFIFIASGWVVMALLIFGHIYPRFETLLPINEGVNLISDHEEVLVFKRMDSAFPFNSNRTFPIVENIEAVDLFLKHHPCGLILTNHKSTILESATNLELVFRCKSPFENHVTRIFKLKPSN